MDSDYEIEIKGKTVAPLDKGRLYLIVFEAPVVYYFDRDIQKFRDLVKTVQLSN